MAVEIVLKNSEAAKSESQGGENEEYLPPSLEAVEGFSYDKIGDAAQLFGKVVGIVRRNMRQYCASIDPTTISDASFGEELGFIAQAVAVDRKLPRVWISSKKINTLVSMRLLVSIDDWPVDSLYPIGHYTEVIGKIGDKAVETKILLQELGVSCAEFSNKVMACLPPASWSISSKDLEGRADFRALPICSIDPPGCKDIDDALHCVATPGGKTWHVGVHIAGIAPRTRRIAAKF